MAATVAVLPINAPYAVLSIRFGKAKDPAALQRALASSRIRLLPCDTLEQALRTVEDVRPIAGLLHFGAGIDAAAVAATAALAERAPRLRLIALVEPAQARSAALARLVGQDLIHDFHTLPISRDRLMFSLGHIAGLVALEESAGAGDAPAAEALTLPDLTSARRELEETLLRQALRLTGGNIKRAARDLGVSRVTIYRLMEKYGCRPLGRALPCHPMPRLVPERPPPPRYSG
jgi:ActR/RegA family two-component response regulator